MDVVIPARNAAATIGPIIDAFGRADCDIGRVIVVDDGSEDETGAAAARAGALVIPGPGIGKGQAVTAGLAHVTTGRVIFCDANLSGFTPLHAFILAKPYAGMLLGVIPGLAAASTGERSLPTWLAQGIALDGYVMECQLNWATDMLRLPARRVSLPGVFKPKYRDMGIADLRVLNDARDREFNAVFRPWAYGVHFGRIPLPVPPA